MLVMLRRLHVGVFKNLIRGCVHLHFACNYESALPILAWPVQGSLLTNIIDVTTAVKKSVRIQHISLYIEENMLYRHIQEGMDAPN